MLEFLKTVTGLNWIENQRLAAYQSGQSRATSTLSPIFNKMTVELEEKLRKAEKKIEFAINENRQLLARCEIQEKQIKALEKDRDQFHRVIFVAAQQIISESKMVIMK